VTGCRGRISLCIAGLIHTELQPLIPSGIRGFFVGVTVSVPLLCHTAISVLAFLKIPA